MKTSAKKSATTTATTVNQAANQPFFAKAGGGDFFAPAAQASAPAVQMKMTVNQPGDKFEQEADKMSNKVMRMPTPASPMKEEKLQRQTDDKLQKKDEDKIQKAAIPEEKLQKKDDERIQKAAMPEEKLQKKDDEKIQKALAPEEKLQRKGDSAPAVGASTQSAIQSHTTGGQPLSSDVRSYMEPRFNADFSNVRVHSDPEAAGLSNQLSARAFTYQNHVFFSRDQYQPGSSEGKQLLAHELTHTIQQGHAVQRSAHVSTTTTPPPVQRFGVQNALDYFADKAYHIPGFRMLTIVLGFNPINQRSTDRSAANILRALIELVPGGHLITQALDNHGVFTRAGEWVEQQIATLGDIGGDIAGSLRRFLDSLSWTDIGNLDGVWERAKSIFTAPISRLISFAGSVVTGIMRFVKEAVLRPLAAMAEGTRGYDLLKAILGEDPITGNPVPRNAETLIGGFMKLIGQEEVWENIKKGNAVARAWTWFQGALAGLLGFVRAIPGQIVAIFTSLTWQDVISVVGIFTKVGGAFLNIAGQFISWAGAQVMSLLEIIFAVVAPGAVPYLKKAQGAFRSIIQNPIGFVGNLVRAGKLGFEMFASRIGEHLKAALIKWIVGPLGAAGVYIPKSFSLMEIIKLVLSVLGLTWQNIRAKLVKIIPEPVLTGLEKTAGILVTLVTQGPVAAWEQIKAELSELKDSLIAQITEMVTTEVVKAAVVKLATMLNPAGAVIQAIIAIYNTITFFIQKINEIAAVVASFIDSIAAIAAGQVTSAAKRVEQTLANTLTVVIAFLAKFAGLGNIPEKVVGIIKRIRQPIDKGLDKIVTWLGNMLKKAGSAIKQAITSFFTPKSFKVGSEEHRLYPDNDGNAFVASKAQRLKEALSALGGDVSKAVQLENINKQIKATKDPAEQEKLKEKADKLTVEIIDALVKLKYGEGTKDKMAKAVVSFLPPGNDAATVNEFKRQIQMHHDAINSMKVGDWQRNRARFIGFGRNKKEDKKETRTNALIVGLRKNPDSTIAKLKEQGLLIVTTKRDDTKTLKDAIKTSDNATLEQIIKSIMGTYGSSLAVLHTLDQVAGGAANVYGAQGEGIFGDKDINSSIGSQWDKKINLVDTAAKDVKSEAAVEVDLTPRQS